MPHIDNVHDAITNCILSSNLYVIKTFIEQNLISWNIIEDILSDKINIYNITSEEVANYLISEYLYRPEIMIQFLKLYIGNYWSEKKIMQMINDGIGLSNIDPQIQWMLPDHIFDDYIGSSYNINIDTIICIRISEKENENDRLIKLCENFIFTDEEIYKIITHSSYTYYPQCIKIAKYFVDLVTDYETLYAILVTLSYLLSYDLFVYIHKKIDGFVLTQGHIILLCYLVDCDNKCEYIYSEYPNEHKTHSECRFITSIKVNLANYFYKNRCNCYSENLKYIKTLIQCLNDNPGEYHCILDLLSN